MADTLFFGSLIHPVKSYVLPAWYEHLGTFSDLLSDGIIVSTSDDEGFNEEARASVPFPLEVLPGDNLFSRISNARSAIYRAFLETEHERMFMLECDLFVERQVVERLSEVDRDVVGVPYVLGYETDPDTRLKKDYLVSVLDFERRRTMTLGELLGIEEQDGLVQVNEMGLGCMMMSKRTVHGIDLSAYHSGSDCDDKLFYRALRDLGVDRFAVPSLIPHVKHFPHFHMEYATYAEYVAKHR